MGGKFWLKLLISSYPLVRDVLGGEEGGVEVGEGGPNDEGETRVCVDCPEIDGAIEVGRIIGEYCVEVVPVRGDTGGVGRLGVSLSFVGPRDNPLS